jgi:hypothetical protein
LHAVDDIWKECDHVIIAHGHVCNNPFQGNLLGRVVLVFLTADGLKLSPELRYFTLLMNERLTYIHILSPSSSGTENKLAARRQLQLRKGRWQSYPGKELSVLSGTHRGVWDRKRRIQSFRVLKVIVRPVQRTRTGRMRWRFEI